MIPRNFNFNPKTDMNFVAWAGTHAAFCNVNYGGKFALMFG